MRDDRPPSVVVTNIGRRFGAFGLCFGITCCASHHKVTLLVLFCTIGTRSSASLTRVTWLYLSLCPIASIPCSPACRISEWSGDTKTAAWYLSRTPIRALTPEPTPPAHVEPLTVCTRTNRKIDERDTPE